MNSRGADEALEFFHKFNESGKATLSIVSPSVDDEDKTWKYHVFMFFPKQDGSYTDTEVFSNDLKEAIEFCVNTAEHILLKELLDEVD